MEFPLVSEVQQVDVAFLIDTTGSMGSTVDAVKSEFVSIVYDLEATIEDGQYGAGTYDDYNYSTYGSGSDQPFYLRHQIW